ncbi:glycosyltransferase [Natrialbaceae archaeon A-gly3]
MNSIQFSVLIATYEGDDPDDLARALRSVIDQTVQPDEIVVVADGSLTPELDAVLDEMDEKHPDLFQRTALSNNRGLGAALNHGVEICSHEWVARMDADDVAVENRFERQLVYITEHPETDVVGGYIGEFDENPDYVNRVREVPTTHEEIAATGRFRCPMNHPSVMFRRRAVIDAGNYREYRSMQDYELWMRMVSKGYTLCNLPTVLVKCHAGEDLYHRRGGLDYARTEFTIYRELLRHGSILFPVFVFNLAMRLPVRVLPAGFRALIYKRILRE